MPLVINTNVAALNSQRQLVSSGNDLAEAMERLSSGKRVNTAADDAAGLAIANRMTSQIRGLDQAIRNANDGVSLMQTAEGALDETTNILQRIRELSIQSANGIYDNSDRSTLDAEVQQLVTELNRIAETTTFNGQKLLDGSLGDVDLHIGANANETVTLEIPALDAKSLGMGSQEVDLLGSEISDLSTVTLRDTDILINGQGIGEFDGTAPQSDTFRDLLDNINENVLGIDASGYTSLEADTVGDGVLENGYTMQITVIAADGSGNNIYNITNTENMDEVIDRIAEVTGGTISADTDDKGRLVLTNNTGSTIQLDAIDNSVAADNDAAALALEQALGFDLADAGGTAQSQSARGQIILTSEHDDPITVSRGATGTLAHLEALGFRESNTAGTIEGVGISSPAQAWNVGDLTINGVQISNDDTDSLQGKVDAINASAADTGVTASTFVSATLDFAGVTATDIAAEAEVLLNGVAIDLSGVDATDTVQDVVAAFNAQKDSTGITATLLGTRVVLEGSASSMAFADGATGTWSGLGTAGVQLSSGTAAAAPVATGDTVNGGIKLASDNGTPISVELGVNADPATLGFVEANSTAGGRFGAAIDSISIDTQKGAQRAIDVVDRALEEVNAVRSDIGAVTNRLEFTMSNLMNVSENTSAARSRIMDADFAAETANLSRAQVLQQASQAMLAQANAKPQQVLQLLNG